MNFTQATVTVSAKARYRWSPKAYKGREIPVPESLLDSLSMMKPKNPRGLIFPGHDGQPHVSLIDVCKPAAQRARLNPDDFWLHKFRATFASWHLRSGVDVRTVQAWLGHESLSSTMRISSQPGGPAVQKEVNATFASIGGAA